jgi:(1->4)-alpha-D-glucan 1-alpha-D-glucosylmutase
VLDGVRVDHPDGLRDPLEYLKRLRKNAPDAYIVGEKILEPGEFLRESWPIEGTTGYDFLNVAAGVLVAPEGMAELTSVYGDFTDQITDFHSIAHEKKISVTQEGLGSDVNRLTSLFVEICEANRDRRDYTRAEVRRAIREVAACFAIYRTYVVPDRDEITDEDKEHITRATECAKEQRLDIDADLFDFLRDVLTMVVKGKQESEFVLRFQQFTGPVMAKGVEDTAFYCYNRLTGMNEVGSDPGRNGLSVGEFHSYCARMQETHPLTMTTLSTHDTKRSDDVRARMAVLSEIPGRFNSAIQRWARMNSAFRTKKPGSIAMPDRNTEYLYYQTLIGAWPLPIERVQAYMLKAVREAKQQTSWVANHKDFEEALRMFIELTLNYAPFLREMNQFVARVQDAGRVNSLTQTLLKYTAPGMPDLYQGGELWDLSLVDPDNRRPVDYALRKRLLCELKQMTGTDVAAQVMMRADEGLPKMWTIHKALEVRRERPDCFNAEAEYTPVEVDGAKHDHVIAYQRGEDVVTVAPRLTVKLDGSWKDTIVVLPKGRWRNRLTGGVVAGGVIPMKMLLKDFPVALLLREGVGAEESNA